MVQLTGSLCLNNVCQEPQSQNKQTNKNSPDQPNSSDHKATWVLRIMPFFG